MVMAKPSDPTARPAAGLHPGRVPRPGDLRSGRRRGRRPAPNRAYSANNARAIKFRSAVYDSADDTVTLVPSKPFALTKPVQLVIDGRPPSGLQDGSGRFIDGGRTGTAGSNGVAILSRGGASVEALLAGTTGGQAGGIMAVVDALFERDGLAGLTTER